METRLYAVNDIEVGSKCRSTALLFHFVNANILNWLNREKFILTHCIETAFQKRIPRKKWTKYSKMVPLQLMLSLRRKLFIFAARLSSMSGTKYLLSFPFTLHWISFHLTHYLSISSHGNEYIYWRAPTVFEVYFISKMSFQSISFYENLVKHQKYFVLL